MSQPKACTFQEWQFQSDGILWKFSQSLLQLFSSILAIKVSINFKGIPNSHLLEVPWWFLGLVLRSLSRSKAVGLHNSTPLPTTQSCTFLGKTRLVCHCPGWFHMDLEKTVLMCKCDVKKYMKAIKHYILVLNSCAETSNTPSH